MTESTTPRNKPREKKTRGFTKSRDYCSIITVVGFLKSQSGITRRTCKVSTEDYDPPRSTPDLDAACPPTLDLKSGSSQMSKTTRKLDQPLPQSQASPSSSLLRSITSQFHNGPTVNPLWSFGCGRLLGSSCTCTSSYCGSGFGEQSYYLHFLGCWRCGRCKQV